MKSNNNNKQTDYVPGTKLSILLNLTSILSTKYLTIMFILVKKLWKDNNCISLHSHCQPGVLEL